LLRLPSFTVTRFSSGIWSKSSPVTVAGTAPDFRRLPYYPRSRADLVRAAGLGGFWMEGKGGVPPFPYRLPKAKEIVAPMDVA